MMKLNTRMDLRMCLYAYARMRLFPVYSPPLLDNGLANMLPRQRIHARRFLYGSCHIKVKCLPEVQERRPELLESRDSKIWAETWMGYEAIARITFITSVESRYWEPHEWTV
jgi:hypothetical protein